MQKEFRHQLRYESKDFAVDVLSWVTNKFCEDSVFLRTRRLHLSQQIHSERNKFADLLPRDLLVAYRDLVIVSAVGAQALAAGSCRTASVRRCQGCSMLDTATSSCFQPAPMDPLQDTTEPVRQVDGVSGKMCLRNLKTLHRQ